MEQREIAAIAGGVQRRRRFGDVLADDRRVADLPITKSELVVGEADGFGIVRLLGVAQAPVRAARSHATGRLWRTRSAREAARARKAARAEDLREMRRAAAERRRCLRDVVAHQPRFGERASQADLVLVLEARRISAPE